MTSQNYGSHLNKEKSKYSINFRDKNLEKGICYKLK